MRHRCAPWYRKRRQIYIYKLDKNDFREKIGDKIWRSIIFFYIFKCGILDFYLSVWQQENHILLNRNGNVIKQRVKKYLIGYLKNNKNAAFAKISRFHWVVIGFFCQCEKRTRRFSCGKAKISNCACPPDNLIIFLFLSPLPNG